MRDTTGIRVTDRDRKDWYLDFIDDGNRMTGQSRDCLIWARNLMNRGMPPTGESLKRDVAIGSGIEENNFRLRHAHVEHLP